MDPLDPFAGLKKAKEEYKVYDSHYEKIGKVDDLLVDGNDRVLYIGVKMGLFGTNSTVVPAEIIRVNDRRQLIEVSEPAESIKHAPHFGHGEELDPELENHVRSYYGLEGLKPTPEHDPQGRNVPETDRLGPDPRVDTVPGERSDIREEGSSTPRTQRSLDIPIGDEEDTQADRDTGTGGRWESEPAAGGVTVHRLRR